MLITWFSVWDLLDTRCGQLVVYSPYIPPLFSFIAPTCCKHIPYMVLQPWGVCWTGWSIAGHDMENDYAVPSVPVWQDICKGLMAW